MFLLTFVTISIFHNILESSSLDVKPINVVELTDVNWDQIQKGQWLIGFFDKDTKESQTLEKDWPVFAAQCKEQHINVGRVFAPHNPALYVRFLVTDFPKVFYIKNGVAHEVKLIQRESLVELIKEKKWTTLKPVNFLNNPFSIQMSILSHLFVHAVNLYNFEDAIVQKIVPFSSATDIAFGLTFIIVGTFLGLLLTCAFGLFQVFFMESRTSEDSKKTDQDVSDSDTTNSDDKITKEKETMSPKAGETTRKRK